MKLSISNIGWSSENDIDIYELMNKYGYKGLEIAPTRIFPENPYDKNVEAKEWRKKINEKYGFEISSIQSIWFGRNEKLFGEKEERNFLLDYTKKTIDFANSINCKNIVFGCPRNRNITNDSDKEIAIDFFKQIGDYANRLNTVIGIEANPPIYNTNFINDTLSALELIKQVDSKGFLLNLDVGTMIQNDEDVSELVGQVKYINHVHISEPELRELQKRELHKKLKKILEEEYYQNYISIECGKNNDLNIIEKNIEYVKSVFL